MRGGNKKQTWQIQLVSLKLNSVYHLRQETCRKMWNEEEGEDLNQSALLLPDQTHLSPVQETVLSWQPTHVRRESRRDAETHTHARCALVGSLNNWSTLRALHVRGLPVSSASGFRCIYQIYCLCRPLTSDPLAVRFCRQPSGAEGTPILLKSMTAGRLWLCSLGQSWISLIGWFKRQGGSQTCWMLGSQNQDHDIINSGTSELGIWEMLWSRLKLIAGTWMTIQT